MSASGLVDMRLAATVVHAVPGVRLRLRLGDAPPVDVARPSADEGDVVPACAFREAVVRAHRADQEGIEVSEGTVPRIEVDVPRDGCVHPSGIIRVGFDRVEVHAFATTLTPEACFRLVTTRAGDRLVHLHHDEGTGVTLVHVEATPRDRTAVLALMDDLLAGCVTEELIGS